MFSKEAYLAQLVASMEFLPIIKKLGVFVITVYLAFIVGKIPKISDKFDGPFVFTLGWILSAIFYLNYFSQIAWYSKWLLVLCGMQILLILSTARYSYTTILSKSMLGSILILLTGVFPFERLLMGGDWWTFNDKNFQVFFYDLSPTKISLLTIIIFSIAKIKLWYKLMLCFIPIVLLAHTFIVAQFAN